jgi:signal transduction histidine kinase
LLIKEDAAGKLWLGSHRGFSILDPDGFTVKTLTTANGLPQNDIASRAVFDRNGRWMVGTDNGFFAFQPQAFTRDSTPPQVVLQTVSFTKSGSNTDSSIILNDRKSIELAYNENRLNFSFVGLHYNNPGLNQYQYKLEGYDKEWSTAGTQRFAAYTNLSPGSYTFLVKGSNSDGVWTKEPTKLEVVIHPPWWQTWWAYSLYAIAVALAIGGFIAYRSKALRRENKVLEDKVAHRTEQLQNSIENLKTTQTQLVQAEKMASLGELTAGIAHEIQNPLNFVNNFSEVSAELVTELKEELEKGNTEDVAAIADDLNANLQKIVHHGKRADSIVKNMLQHSRSSNGSKEATDINAMVDEYLRLSYHGLRAKDKSFNAVMETHFDPAVEKVLIHPQELGRVILNLLNNAFYSVHQQKRVAGKSYEPTVSVSTFRNANGVTIQIKDNGTGIPQAVLDKIFQPFFTTKPTGEGTGLGLSLSYDIIIKGHDGKLTVSNGINSGAEFNITLPA